MTLRAGFFLLLAAVSLFTMTSCAGDEIADDSPLFEDNFDNVLADSTADDTGESFVDKLINSPLLLEENPADEFLGDKKEINSLAAAGNFEEVRAKLAELRSKEIAKYGDTYEDYQAQHAALKLAALETDKNFAGVFPYNVGNYSEIELQQKLSNENTWKNFDAEVSKLSLSPRLNLKNYLVIFKVDKKVLGTCQEILGEMHPVTLNRAANLVRDYSILGDSKTALKLGRDLLPKVEEVFGESSDETVAVMRLMANDYKILFDYRKSEILLEKMLAINNELHGENSGESAINLAEIVLLWDVDKFRMDYYRNALKKINEFLSEEDKANYGVFRAQAVYFRNIAPNQELQGFKTAFEKESAESQRTGEPIFFDSLFELAECVRDTGILSQALATDLNSLAICRSYFGNYHHATIKSMCNLSDDYLKLNDVAAALNFSKTALKISQEIYGENHPCTINAVHTLTNVYRKIGRYNDALQLDTQAYEVAKANFTNTIGIPAWDGEIITVADAKETFEVWLGRLAERVKFYEKTNRQTEAKDLSRKLAGLRKKLSAPSYIENLSQEEILDINHRLILLYSNENPATLLIQKDFINDYEGLQRYDDAIKYEEDFYGRYSTLKGGISPEALISRMELAHLYNLSGKYEKTIDSYTYEYNNQYDLLRPLDNLTVADRCRTFYIIGKAFENVKNYSEALKYYEKVIDGLEDLRSSNQNLTADENRQWFSTVVPYYKEIAAFLVTQKKSEQAFEIANLCKARTLAEQYNELLASYKGGLSEQDISQLNAYQRNISRYNEQIAESVRTANDDLTLNLKILQSNLINDYLQYREQLQEKYPKYLEVLNATISRNDILDKAQLTKILPNNSCFIDFTLIKKADKFNRKDNEILAFVVSKSGAVEGFNISVDDNFFELCNLYRELLAYSGIERMRADNKYLWKLPDGNYKISTGRQAPAQNAAAVSSTQDLNDLRQDFSAKIGAVLLKPLQNAVASNTTWIISADGELNNVPFETLQFQNKSVVESANVSYVPSPAVFKLMKEKADTNSQIRNRKELFAMGDAVYGNYDLSDSRGSLIDLARNIESLDNTFETLDLTQLKWNNLPGTGKELDRVSTVFADKEILRGQAASETNLKALNKNGNLSQYKYLLFATHGLFVPQRPELSSIVLSQGVDSIDDGYVTIGEWMNYSLNSDLVYLSACESGLGEYLAGEGIVGIPYALTISGNKDTVMSLWKVDDEATAEFSTTFFQKLSQGKTEITALNETKREFIQKNDSKYSDLSVWAAFVLYGF